jgi:hypothetical protein
MNGEDNKVVQGSRWADITAVLSVVCIIGVLYLPLIL